MNLQALLIRAIASIASGLMLTAAVLIASPARTTASPAAIAPTATLAAARPQPVVLPTIHVRPTPQQRVAAANYPEAPAAAKASIVEAALRQDVSAAIATPSLRGLEVDMPYYSFGKILPRIGRKE